MAAQHLLHELILLLYRFHPYLRQHQPSHSPHAPLFRVRLRRLTLRAPQIVEVCIHLPPFT